MKNNFFNKENTILLVILLIFAFIYVVVITNIKILTHDEAHLPLERMFYYSSEPFDIITCHDMIRCYRAQTEHMGLVYGIFSALMFKLFGFSEYIYRFPYVILNLILILSVYLISIKLTKNKLVSYLSSILSGIWVIHYPVYASSNIGGFAFTALSFFFLYMGIEENNIKYFLIGIFLLIIDYLNNLNSIIVLITILSLVIFYYYPYIVSNKYLNKNKILIFLLIALPLVIKTIINFHYNSLINPSEKFIIFNLDFRGTIIEFLISILYIFIFSVFIYFDTKEKIKQEKVKNITLFFIILLFSIFPFFMLKGSLSPYVFKNPIMGNFKFGKINLNFLLFITYFIPPSFLIIFSFYYIFKSFKILKTNRNLFSKLLFLLIIFILIISNKYINSWYVNSLRSINRPTSFYVDNVRGIYINDIRVISRIIIVDVFIISLMFYILSNYKIKKGIKRLLPYLYTGYIIAYIRLLYLFVSENFNEMFNELSLIIVVSLLLIILFFDIKKEMFVVLFSFFIYVFTTLFWNRRTYDDYHYYIYVIYSISLITSYTIYKISKFLLKDKWNILFLFFSLLIIYISFTEVFNISTTYAYINDPMYVTWKYEKNLNGNILDYVSVFETPEFYFTNKRGSVAMGNVVYFPFKKINIGHIDDLVHFLYDYKINYISTGYTRNIEKMKEMGIIFDCKKEKMMHPIIIRKFIIYPNLVYITQTTFICKVNQTHLEFLFGNRSSFIYYNNTLMRKLEKINKYNISKYFNGDANKDSFYEWSNDFYEINKIKNSSMFYPTYEKHKNIISLRSLVDLNNDIRVYYDTHYHLNSQYLRGLYDEPPNKLYINEVKFPFNIKINHLYIVFSEINSKRYKTLYENILNNISIDGNESDWTCLKKSEKLFFGYNDIGYIKSYQNKRKIYVLIKVNNLTNIQLKNLNLFLTFVSDDIFMKPIYAIMIHDNSRPIIYKYDNNGNRFGFYDYTNKISYFYGTNLIEISIDKSLFYNKTVKYSYVNLYNSSVNYRLQDYFYIINENKSLLGIKKNEICYNLYDLVSNKSDISFQIKVKYKNGIETNINKSEYSLYDLASIKREHPLVYEDEISRINVLNISLNENKYVKYVKIKKKNPNDGVIIFSILYN